MYLDPGFGGILLQVLVAVAAAGGALLFSLSRKFKAMFSKKSGTEDVGQSTAIKADLSDDAIDTLSDNKDSNGSN